MFYIVKENEPQSLAVYKKIPGAYYDGYTRKEEIRQKLLEEQGYLCAYCMRRIKSTSDVTIEHYIPQSKLDEIMALNYKNMLGVCKLNRKCEKKNQTCDAHRGNDKLTVDPWNNNSIELIEYQQGTGIIYSKNDDVNKDLDKTLNLNCVEARLPGNRKAALDSLKSFLKQRQPIGTWNVSMLRKIEQFYSSKDNEGKYKEYMGILLWYIRKRIRN